MTDIRGLLLDIDNTIFNYESAHIPAMLAVCELGRKMFRISNEDFYNIFELSRNKVNIQLYNTASSHNRLLYFQNLTESFNRNSISQTLELYNTYWDTFINNIELYEGVLELFKKYQNRICFVTDLTAQIQFRKIVYLNLHNYANKIVTSEEVGIEKPNNMMFNTAMYKLGLHHKEVIMIGDNFQKDIEGATKMGIRAIWLNNELEEKVIKNELVIEVNNFKEILNII